MDNIIIEAVTKIGNFKEVKEMIEPNVMQPLQLENWMVRRALHSLCLMLDACDELEENNGS